MNIQQTKCDQCGEIRENKGHIGNFGERKVHVPPKKMIHVDTSSGPDWFEFDGDGLAKTAFDFCSEKCLVEFFAKRLRGSAPAGPAAMQPKFGEKEIDEMVDFYAGAWKSFGLDLLKWREKLARFESMLEE